MLYVIFGEEEYAQKVLTCIPVGRNIIICSSFSSLAGNYQSIEKLLLEGDDRTCILVHNALCTVPIEEALYLREICGAEKIYDWCCSANWKSYVSEASNVTMLTGGNDYYMTDFGGGCFEASLNPFNGVLFGTEIDEKWDDKGYSTQIKKKYVPITGVIRKLIANYIWSSLDQPCTVRDYEAVCHKFEIGKMHENLHRNVPDESFYNDDFSWEEVFSKRSSVNIEKILRRRVLGAEDDIEFNANIIKEKNRDVLRRLLAQYEQTSKRGIYSTYSLFKDYIIPEFEKHVKDCSAELLLVRDAENQFKENLQAAADIASRASRIGGERELLMDDYIGALESYRGCLLRIIFLKSLLSIHEDILGEAKCVIYRLEGIIETCRSYAVSYRQGCEVDGAPLFCIEPVDTEMVNNYIFEGRITDLELVLKDKYTKRLVDRIKIEKRNSSVQIQGDYIVWFEQEKVDLYEKMSELFAKKIKGPKDRDLVYRKWILRFMDEGVLRKMDNGYELIKHKALSRQVYDVTSVAELLRLHNQIETEKTAEVIMPVPVTGTIAKLSNYLQEHIELMKLLNCQLNIVRQNRIVRDRYRKELLSVVP